MYKQQRIRLLGLGILLITLFSLINVYADNLQSYKFGTETLLVPIPDGWQQGYAQQNDTVIMKEYVPSGQSVDSWSEMVTVQIFPGLTKVTPDEFLNKIAIISKQSCSDFKSESVAPSTNQDNAYPRATSMQYCTKYDKTGKGEITLLLAIHGDGALFMVQHAWRGDAFSLNDIPLNQAEKNKWVDFMGNVVLCGARSQSLKCSHIDATTPGA